MLLMLAHSLTTSGDSSEPSEQSFHDHNTNVQEYRAQRCNGDLSLLHDLVAAVGKEDKIHEQHKLVPNNLPISLNWVGVAKTGRLRPGFYESFSSQKRTWKPILSSVLEFFPKFQRFRK